MKKIISLGFVTLVCAISFGQQFNTINAVTSASGNFEISGGKAYDTLATITWKERDLSATTEILKWGVNPSYGNSKNLLPISDTNFRTSTITGLLPSKQYYVQFHRVYNNEPHHVNLSFTTVAKIAVINKKLHSKGKFLKGTTERVYALNGQKLTGTNNNTVMSSSKGIRLYERNYKNKTLSVTPVFEGF